MRPGVGYGLSLLAGMALELAKEREEALRRRGRRPGPFLRLLARLRG